MYMNTHTHTHTGVEVNTGWRKGALGVLGVLCQGLSGLGLGFTLRGPQSNTGGTGTSGGGTAGSQHRRSKVCSNVCSKVTSTQAHPALDSGTKGPGGASVIVSNIYITGAGSLGLCF